MDAVCTNRLSATTREWLTRWENSQEKVPLPRAREISLPQARENLEIFKSAVEMSLLATNRHTHSRTCIKGKRERTQCRLGRPAGIHDSETQPLHITRSESGCKGAPLDSETKQKLDESYDPELGEFLRPYIPGPIVWEQFRPESEGMFVETNTLLSGLTGSHCNSSVMNGEDAGDMVDEYQQNYMTKEGSGLKNAASVMLTAVEDVIKYLSVAEDSGTPIRQGQYLSTPTVNAFEGAHEWSLSLMVYALLGHRSYVSSEAFWYVFPHGFVKELRKSELTHTNPDKIPSDRCFEDSDDDSSSDSDCDSGSLNIDEDENTDVDCVSGSKPIYQAIEELADFAHTEDLSGQTNSVNGSHCTGGTRSYKINVDPYRFRKEYFRDFSPTEFACIVDLVPRRTSRNHYSNASMVLSGCGDGDSSGISDPLVLNAPMPTVSAGTASCEQ
ncbi:hypothetical protein GN958_ATG00874 [Phytophthora infestans]|uniref:Uncharacterized protein n=1 Tax=Phytophthora infestans TaxID=4787 RepID=A0A8S9VA77_PHYIN|nr:hypothetical protein GN958_ATG00874 [Phytophthora infestans]